MSKRVNQKIVIDSDGNIVATPEGTQGRECIDLMAFLDRIPGFTVVEVKRTDDFKDGDREVSPDQKVIE